jgi:hypothetical protein
MNTQLYCDLMFIPKMEYSVTPLDGINKQARSTGRLCYLWLPLLRMIFDHWSNFELVSVLFFCFFCLFFMNKFILECFRYWCEMAPDPARLRTCGRGTHFILRLVSLASFSTLI